MEHKLDDKILCKRNCYSGTSSRWYFRIFQKKRHKLLEKNKWYEITGYFKEIPIAVKGLEPNDIHILFSDEKIGFWQENWRNHYFYKDIKEIRKMKLAKINK